MSIKLRESGSDIVKKAIITTMSTFIMSFGMALMIRAGVGADSFTLFAESLGGLLNTTAGNATNIVNALFVVIMLIFDRRLIYFSTVIVFAGIGFMLDFCNYILGFLISQSLPFEVSLIILIIGNIVLGFGIGFYVSLDFGGAPADGVMIIIYKAIKLPYKVCMWIFYALCILLAMLFGYISGHGNMPGLGTIIALVVVGLVCDTTIKFFKKRWKKILRLDGDPAIGLAVGD